MRGLLRPHAQLGGEGAHAGIVLLQGGRALAGLGIERHQRALGGLVQRVKRHPAPRVFDGQLHAAGAGVGVDVRQPCQRPCQIALQRLPLRRLPRLELTRIGQAEPGQEALAVQLGRFGQRGHAFLAQVMVRMAVCAGLAGQRAEAAHVHPQACLLRQADLLVAQGKPALADGPVQAGQAAAQHGACALLVEVGPEQAGQLVAADGMRDGGQVSEERDGFAPPDVHGRAVTFDARWAE